MTISITTNGCMQSGNAAMSTGLPKYWFAIRVRLFHELKTRDNLEKMGIECFVPIHSEVRIWHDRRVIKDRVLTPQLIFIHATEKERIETLSLSFSTFISDSRSYSFAFRVL